MKTETLEAMKALITSMELLVGDIESLRAAKNFGGITKIVFTNWNTGDPLLPEPILKEALERGIDCVLSLKEQQLRQLRLPRDSDYDETTH